MDLRFGGFSNGRGGLPALTPLRITLIYVAFGLALLFVSDVLWPRWIADPEQVRRFQGIKGALEILVSGGVIYLLVARMSRDRRRAERRYRNLIETSPAPINLFDADGTIVWGNDAVLDLLGLEDREDLGGRSIFEFVHAEDRPTAEDELSAVVEGGESAGPTYMRLETDDGTVRQVRVSTAPGWYRGERVGQAVVIDVTERHELEGELRRERDFFQDAIDELRDVFYLVTPDGDVERWNERLIEVTGYGEDEIASMEATDFFPPEDERRIEEAIEDALESGSSFVEADLVTSEGERRRYEFRSTRLEWPDDRDGIVGVGRDVTERERMERELRENERRYRTLVEMSPNPILVHADGEIRYANDAMLDLIGGESREELVGTHINRYVRADEQGAVERTARRTQRGEEAPTRHERTVVTLGGETRYVETTSRPIAYEGDPAVLTVIADVTDRHRYEEMLTALHDRTRAMTRAEGRDAIARLAVETTDELVEPQGTAVYEFDDGTALTPVATSAALADGPEEMPTVERGDGPMWEAFVDGEERVIDDEGALPMAPARVLPVGNHGALAVSVRDDRSLSAARQNILHLIGENLGAALDRAERERTLQERDRQLNRQNQSLRQLNRLNEVIREINQTLIRSSTRSEIRAGACEQFAAAEEYAFAWIGTRDAIEGEITPQAYSGADAEYIDLLDPVDPETPLYGLLDATFRTGSIHVAQRVLEQPEWEAYRSEALNQGYRAVAAIPVVVDAHVENVLVVHASEGDIFDDAERAVLEELGHTVGYVMRNVDRVQAIQRDEHTEIEVTIDDERLFTNAISRELDADVEYVGAIHEDGTLRAFLRLTGVSGDGIEERLSASNAVREVELLSSEDDTCLCQLTIETPALVRALQGTARLRALRAERGTTTCTIAIEGGIDVRSLLEELRATYPSAELVARRERERPIETRETFRERLVEGLTEKQFEALQTAYFGGFYEWPRSSTNEELARVTGVAASTFQYHLRTAERKVIAGLLDAP